MSASQSAVDLLDENPPEVLGTVYALLLQIADNILGQPEEIKFRRLRLSNKNVAEKLMPAIGAIECLFEMGFEEAEDSFVLAGSTSLNPLRRVRDRLAQKSLSISKPPATITLPTSPKIVSHQQFLQRVADTSLSVATYEDPILQRRARGLMPVGELWLAAQRRLRSQQLEKVLEAERQGLPDLMLCELLSWFKHHFFKWVDQPPCHLCRSPTSYVGMSQDPAHLAQAPRTELFSCPKGHTTPFHRYSNPRRLLETREGRCGEWANCFTLLCRSLGLDARIVYDETDHVWTEVWSVTQSRWLHCDSCEAICDAPLTYQAGWGKKLTYVIAYSRDDVQDVTWRYTQEPTDVVLARRNLCTENELQAMLLRVRARLQASVSLVRRRFLERRLLGELAEMLRVPGQQRAVGSAETQGRQSGSEEWRLQRRETGELSPGWVWRATPAEVRAGAMEVGLSAAQNAYRRGGGEAMQGWSRGVFRASNVARKEERDWNKAYLARTEGSSGSGWVEWRFEAGAGAEVGQVTVRLGCATFGSGRVQWRLVGEQPAVAIAVPSGEESFSSDALQGCHLVTLRAELSGGEGGVAWQHVQLSRQDLSDPAFPIHITVCLRPCTK